jgi:hypothetical protein
MKHRRFHQPTHPASAKGRLSPRREAFVYAIFGALWTSGIAWLVFHYFLRQSGEFGELPHPLEAWSLRLHGAAGFFGLWLLGVLWATHLIPAWRARRRSSGIVLTSVAVVLVVTGYLLYYVGDESARDLIAWAHWGIGIALPLPFLLHALRGRTARPADAGREQHHRRHAHAEGDRGDRV